LTTWLLNDALYTALFPVNYDVQTYKLIHRNCGYFTLGRYTLTFKA